MFLERMENIDPECLIIMNDRITPTIDLEEYKHNRIKYLLPKGELNAFVVCPEDAPMGFRGYAGRFYAIQNYDGDIIATTNLWHRGTIKKGVEVDPELISVCLTDIRWQCSDSRVITPILKEYRWRAYYKDGWHTLEMSDVDRFIEQSYKYVNFDSYLNRKE
jgi:hypothetical protein